MFMYFQSESCEIDVLPNYSSSIFSHSHMPLQCSYRYILDENECTLDEDRDKIPDAKVVQNFFIIIKYILCTHESMYNKICIITRMTALDVVRHKEFLPI